MEGGGNRRGSSQQECFSLCPVLPLLLLPPAALSGTSVDVNLSVLDVTFGSMMLSRTRGPSYLLSDTMGIPQISSRARLGSTSFWDDRTMNRIKELGAQFKAAKAQVATAKSEGKQLAELEASEGNDFPGSDFHSDNHKEWMSTTLDFSSVKVKDVVWPGSHDSATDKIGVYGVSRPLAQCQTVSIYEQLCQGVRMLDIRVENTGRVCHGVLKSYKVDEVIKGLKQFLSETTSEIVLLEIRTEYGYEDAPDFDKWLIEQLGDYLVAQDTGIFDQTLKQVLPKRVICFWKPRTSPAPAPGSFLFSSGFLKDNWTDTDLPLTKFNANMSHLAEQASNAERTYFYRVEITCTPQLSSGILCVKPVTDRIRVFARLFISQAFKKGLGDHLQVLSEDFVSDDFVDACIGVTVSRQSGGTATSS